MGAGALAVLAFAAGQGVSAAEPAEKVTFQFENMRLQPARYTIVVNEDGTGHFRSEVGPEPPPDIAGLPAEGQEREITLSRPLTQRIFAIAKKEKYFSGQCDSGLDGIAFQGKKTLTGSGPQGQGSCTYNYSKDQQIQWITQQFQSVASTLEEGRRLQLEYQHTKLSLDSELDSLQKMVHNGDASELQNIEPLLKVIASDDAVVQHAQRRARELLLTAAAEQAKGK